MLQKNWETTVCCFSREVVELKLSVCHSISWTPLSCADFPVLLWDYPVALLSLFYFCPLNQRLQDLPPSIMVIVCQANLTSSTCQASAGVSVKVTTRDGDSFLLPFRKQHTSRHPQPLFSPAVSEQIWDQLKGWRPWSLEISLQLSGHVRAPAGYNERLLTSAEGWTRRKPHAYCFTLSDMLLPYIVCVQPSWASKVHL